jgi:GT2 family glycosyltransferase
LSSSDRIGVVVLNWFTEEATSRCLTSVLASQGVAPRIYVIDNGSKPYLRERLERDFPMVNFLGERRNIGFAAGANLGAKRALQDGCSTILFLNNDSTLSPDCLRKLVETHGEVVDPLILSPDGQRIWFNGGSISFTGKGRHRDFGKSLRVISVQPSEEAIEFATACVMLVRRVVFEKIGHLDERFFAYSEDLDFSLRARQAGLRLVIRRDARAFHDQSLSVRRNVGRWARDYYVLRNAILNVQKHFGKDRPRERALLAIAEEFSLRLPYFLVTLQFRRLRALILGAVDGIRGRIGAREDL